MKSYNVFILTWWPVMNFQNRSFEIGWNRQYTPHEIADLEDRIHRKTFWLNESVQGDEIANLEFIKDDQGSLILDEEGNPKYNRLERRGRTAPVNWFKSGRNHKTDVNADGWYFREVPSDFWTIEFEEEERGLLMTYLLTDPRFREVTRPFIELEGTLYPLVRLELPEIEEEEEEDDDD
jgi:hypothetical protein